MIDPFGNIEYICENKYKPAVNERGHKYNYIFNENNIEKYDSLILGSSRVMQIIPKHSKYTNGFYNFSLHVANNAEKLFLLKEWLKHKKLKKVYLGIDYYNFHIENRPGYVDYSKFYHFSKNYLSFSTFLLSLKTIKNAIKDEPQVYFELDGELNYYNYNKQIAENRYDFSKQRLLDDGMVNYKKFIDFEVQKSEYDILKDIQELAIKHDFELYVFTTPMYFSVYQLYKSNETIYTKFLSINEELKNIFGKVYLFNVDSEIIKNNRNFYDAVHYRSVIGDEIVLRLNGQSDFGELLTAKK